MPQNTTGLILPQKLQISEHSNLFFFVVAMNMAMKDGGKIWSEMVTAHMKVLIWQLPEGNDGKSEKSHLE
jgi:hypothetical protein